MEGGGPPLAPARVYDSPECAVRFRPIQPVGGGGGGGRPLSANSTSGGAYVC